MLVTICLFVGIMFLVVGTSIMIEGFKDLSNRLHNSTLATGLTVIAFATSIPELLVSIRAIIKGYNDIVIFNVNYYFTTGHN